MPKSTETTIRVRFADTDADGGVFHANYITYFSIGRHDFFNQMGVPQTKLVAEDHVRPTVIEVTCTFRAVAHFDDVLTVRTTFERMGNKSITYVYEIVRKEDAHSETIIASGSTIQVFLDSSGATVPIPDKVRTAFEGE